MGDVRKMKKHKTYRKMKNKTSLERTEENKILKVDETHERTSMIKKENNNNNE